MHMPIEHLVYTDTDTRSTDLLTEYERGQLLAMQALHRGVPMAQIVKSLRLVAGVKWSDDLRGYVDTIIPLATKEPL